MPDPLDHLRSALSDRYRIEREIGAGGMATVYLAEDLKHHRKVALKVLRPELAAALGPDRFLREIEIAAALQHPHILPLYDSGQIGGQADRRLDDSESSTTADVLFYVMPFVEGESLRARLHRQGELPVAEAARILRDVTDALAYAHHEGVVHRDIKPDNVMLSGRHALVTDFGVAKAVSEATGRQQLTTAGVALGTPAYMAPEQAVADPHIDHRADIYALGALAYELLSGDPPFTGPTPQAVLSAHVTTAPQPVSDKRPAVPAQLATLVMKCLEKRPADRWQSADELLPVLESVATPSGGITPTTTQPVSGVHTRGRRRGALVAGAAVVMIGAAAAWALLRGGGETAVPQRLVIAPFENRTGDPANDAWGDLTAEWIMRGIARADLVDVVPMTVVQEALVGNEGGTPSVSELATRTGANVAVSGHYRMLGDRVSFQVEILDAANGDLLGTLDPIEGPSDSIQAVIATAADRVIAAVAVQFDRNYPEWLVSMPPSVEAYEAFKKGQEYFSRSEYAEAVPYLERAIAMDSTWAPAITWLGTTYYNLGNLAKAESLYAYADRFRDRLTSWEQLYQDYIQRGLIAGDLAAELRAARGMAEISPVLGSYRLGLSAGRNNRPREAIESLNRADTSNLWAYNWRPYWDVFAAYLHQIGEHEAELAVAREERRRFPEYLSALNDEVRALIALGRLDEVWPLLEEARTLPPPGTVGGSLRLAARELRVHGHETEARRAETEAIAWYRDRLAAHPGNVSLRASLAVTAYAAGDWALADSLYQPLHAQFPDTPSYIGRIGDIAARRGDRDSAMVADAALQRLDRPYDRGLTTAWRATIAAVLGDRDRAVALLRQAFDEGQPCCSALHLSPDFALLAGYPPYEQFVRPKG